MTRHFLRDDDLTPAEQAEVLDLALRMKAQPYDVRPLAGGQTVALIFDRPTLRTQTSFATGVAALGGFPMHVDGNLAQIGTREPIADVARVLGRQAAAIVWRTGAQADLAEMAAWAGVPVVNALTDDFHPCQLLAELLTVGEHLGELPGRTLSFVGDIGCNVGHSYLLAGATAGMHVRVSGPPDHQPAADVLRRAGAIAAQTGGSVSVVDDPGDACRGADAVATDTWVSMGREAERDARLQAFLPWQLNDDLLSLAAPHAIALHCLPAYRGNEITASVLDGPRSVVWDEAENRTHAQKALLAFLLAASADPVDSVDPVDPVGPVGAPAEPRLGEPA